jgi:hypothetical protein
MGFITARAEVEKSKTAAKLEAADGARSEDQADRSRAALRRASTSA